MSQTATESSSGSSFHPMCSGCGEPLAEKRLQAVPNATECVPCLEKAGDIPTIKRYDETTPDGELVSTHFYKNKRIERQMRRVNTEAAPEEAYSVAVGDDSHLVRERAGENEHAYNMTEAFDTAEEELEALLEKCEQVIAENSTSTMAASA
jgi:hypothetical protein